MHHAYPRECPYPHLSGTTFQQSIFEMDSAVLENSVVTADQAKMVINSLPLQNNTVGPSAVEATCVPWHHVEEFIVHPPATMQSLAALETDPAVWMIVNFIAIITTFSTAMLGLIRVFKNANHVTK